MTEFDPDPFERSWTRCRPTADGGGMFTGLELRRDGTFRYAGRLVENGAVLSSTVVEGTWHVDFTTGAFHEATTLRDGATANDKCVLIATVANDSDLTLVDGRKWTSPLAGEETSYLLTRRLRTDALRATASRLFHVRFSAVSMSAMGRKRKFCNVPLASIRQLRVPTARNICTTGGKLAGFRRRLCGGRNGATLALGTPCLARLQPIVGEHAGREKRGRRKHSRPKYMY